MRKTRIRQATERDAAEIARVLVRSIREVCGPDYDYDEDTLAAWCSNKTPEQARAWVKDPELFTVVAEEEDGVVGVAQLHAAGEIRLCYLIPEALGRGIGAALLSSLEQEARTKGLERLTLTSTITAEAFYRRHRYRDVGEPVSFGIGQAFPMEKQLTPRHFYDRLAPFYHLIFEDWDRSMARQGDALGSVIERWPMRRNVVLDASCGIGTQAIALASKGLTVVGSDISIGSLRRGRRESRGRGVRVASVAADVRALPFRSGCADVVLACDNAIPHLLSLAEIERAMSELRRCARPGGGVILSMREYTRKPPGTVERRSYGEREWNGRRYAVEQKWEWHGPKYDLTMRLRSLDDRSKDPIEFMTTYFAVAIDEVLQVMLDAGLVDVVRLDGVFYQPLLIGSVPVAR